MNVPSPVRVLGAGGLLSAALSTAGGLTNRTVLIGIGSAVMLLANVYALFFATRSHA